MSHHIESIYLRGEKFERYSVVGTADCLTPLSKINLFVGANNCGKSRFLRTLATIQKLQFRTPYDFLPFDDALRALQEGVARVCTEYNCQDINSLKERVRQFTDLSLVTESEQLLGNLSAIVKDLASVTEFTVTQKGGNQTTHGVTDPRIQVPMNKLGESLMGMISEPLGAIPTKFDFIRVYLPTLRGLRTFPGGEDPYAKRTVSDYFQGDDQVKVFTGLTLYHDLRKLLLGNLDDRETVASFQTFLSEAFFEGEPVALIPKHDSDVLDVKIGDETQRPIYSLGDGIQSLIILTFPVFKYRNSQLLLFIEEPELFLHPGMQRHLINVLLRPEFEGAQYFIATHSNHLLDLSLDINKMSVFTFRKQLTQDHAREHDAHVIVENVSNEDERTLQLLGVQNSAVFLSNCTIWVEGITDRRYLLRYLEIYQTHLEEKASSIGHASTTFKQDLHYSFVEYGGSNITHWSFLADVKDVIVVERLCGRLFLITDRDSATGAKAERHKRLKERLGTRYYCLKCREVENLITPEVLLKVLSGYEGSNLLAPELHHRQYRGKPLGMFIEDVLLKGVKSRRGSYTSDSGTISNKTDFAHRSLEHTVQWSDLSLEAQALAKIVYDFIREHNRRHGA